MGSFNSRTRSRGHSDGKEDSQEKFNSNTSPIEEAVSTKTQERANAANEDKAKAGCASQEQLSETKVTPSFSWLVSTPVEYDPSIKKSKDKAKRLTAKGNFKTSDVKYSNGKYLKSIELPFTSNMEPNHNQLHGNACCSTSFSSQTYLRYQRDGGGGVCGEKRDERSSNINQRNIDDVSSMRPAGGSHPIGFGVNQKKDPIAETVSDGSDHSSGSKEQGRSPH